MSLLSGGGTRARQQLKVLFQAISTFRVGAILLSRVRDDLVAAYARLPEHPAKYRLVRWLGRHVVPGEGVERVVYPNVRLRLHPRDWIEYQLLRGERYEPLTLEFLGQNLRLGDCALLAGINMGLHVAVAARAVGPPGRVVGIDPQPSAVLRTMETLRLNSLEGPVQLVSAALGEADAVLPMAWARTEENAGTANLFDEAAGLFVTVTTLSRLHEELAIPRARLLLLDVEGYETKVLAGLRPEHAPEIAVVEVQPLNLARAGVSAEQLFEALQRLGYRLFTLHGEPLEAPVSGLPEHNVVGVLHGVEASWSSVARPG